MVSSEGYDKPSCLNTTSKESCRSLNYVWLHGNPVTCVVVKGVYSNHERGKSLMSKKIDQRKQLQLFCEDCLIENSTLVLRCAKDICEIIFINIIMVNSHFDFGNIIVTFYNSSLTNTTFADLEGIKMYIEIWFIKTRIESYEKLEMSNLKFMHSPVAKLVFSDSELQSCKMELLVTGIIFRFERCKIVRPNIFLSVTFYVYLKIPSFINFADSIFLDPHADSGLSKHKVVLDLSSPSVYIDNTTFKQVYLEINSKRDIFTQVLFYIRIINSSFLDIKTFGKGGALLISMGSDVVFPFAWLSSCRFSSNEVYETDIKLSGTGGALHATGNQLYLVMGNCTFENNFAAKTGMSLFTDKGITLLIYTSSFHFALTAEKKRIEPLVTMNGLVEYFGAFFHITMSGSFIPSGKNMLLISIEKINKINIETECPLWYMPISEFNMVSQNEVWSVKNTTMERFGYKCTACSQGRYTNASNQKTFIFPAEAWIFQPNASLAEDMCIECPYGADCFGNNVVPRPNFWGYKHTGNILTFLRCPAHYCCTGTQESPCTKYNSCAENRAGLLCGECKEGFSLSILSDKCIPDTRCGKTVLFWLVAIFASMAYAAWYTFKEDIFGFPSKCLGNKKLSSEADTRGMTATKQQGQVNDSLNPNTSLKMLNSITGLSANIDIVQNSNSSRRNVDKGYFGIVAYFVQISSSIKIHVDLHESSKEGSFLDTITENIDRAVGIELSAFSFDACPFVGLTMAKKHGYKLAFLVSIYISWCVLYMLVNSFLILVKGKNQDANGNQFKSSIKLTLIRGIVDIIKYTYTGFCGLVFTSIVCKSLGKHTVWWYDAKNVCFENWQIGMIAFGSFYILPFPISLYFGMKYLKQGKISAFIFIMSCVCPIILLCHRLFRPNTKEKTISSASKAIIYVLQGPYREDEKHYTLYWEAVVSLRRLMITGTLIATSLLQMIIASSLCVLFLIQHNYYQPFQLTVSNHVETFSLGLLCFVASINLLKASLNDFGVTPSGPAVPLLKGLQSIEKSLIIILIIFICLVEFKSWRKNRKISKSQDRPTRVAEFK